MDIQTRLQRIEDIEAIKQLKAAYCQACDDDHNPDRLGPLFAQDAVWEASSVGRAEGREAIQKLLGDIGRSGTIRNSAHNVMNPIITVDGDTAEGEWRLIMLYTGIYPNGEHHFSRIIGWYKERYARIGGRWLIQDLYCQVEESAPYLLDPQESFSSKET